MEDKIQTASLPEANYKSDRLLESHYRAGLQAGWNFGLTEDREGFDKVMKAHEWRTEEAKSLYAAPPPPADAVREWQPIETAPKDEYVLVFSQEAAEHTRIMICALFEFEGSPNCPEWRELSCDVPTLLDVAVTHWMPLPLPPDAGSRG